MTRQRLARSIGISIAAAFAGCLCLASCGSLSKPELERRLLDLAKNHGAREAGLSRRALRIDDGDAQVEAEVAYLHVPAAPGNATRRPLVLVHGTPSSLFTWTDVVFGGDGFDGLAGERDVYALDVVGHGVTTGGTEGGVTFARGAESVAAFIRALGLGRVHLVGNSYGGEFCLRVALDHPDLVERLVLVDSSGLTRADDEWLPEEIDLREMSLAPYGYLLNSRERIATALRPHFAELDDERVEEIHLLCENAENWRAMVDLARDENGTREPDLDAITAPTLLVWGERDVAYPIERFARRFENGIPDAHLEVVRDCGHYPQEERPADFLRILRGFLTD